MQRTSHVQSMRLSTVHCHEYVLRCCAILRPFEQETDKEGEAKKDVYGMLLLAVNADTSVDIKPVSRRSFVANPTGHPSRQGDRSHHVGFRPGNLDYCTPWCPTPTIISV